MHFHFHWRIQWGCEVCTLPLGVQILSFSCSFWQNKLQYNRLAHPILGVSAQPSGKSWIRHCQRLQIRYHGMLVNSDGNVCYYAKCVGKCKQIRKIGLLSETAETVRQCLTRLKRAAPTLMFVCTIVEYVPSCWKIKIFFRHYLCLSSSQ